MNISPGESKVLSVLIFGGLTLLTQLAIVVFAIMAARRYMQKGIWFLAAAATLELMQRFLIFLIVSPFNLISHENSIRYLNPVSGYLSVAALIIALVGWYALAFSRKEDVDEHLK